MKSRSFVAVGVEVPDEEAVTSLADDDDDIEGVQKKLSFLAVNDSKLLGKRPSQQTRLIRYWKICGRTQSGDLTCSFLIALITTSLMRSTRRCHGHEGMRQGFNQRDIDLRLS
jgi:hypothetical protein